MSSYKHLVISPRAYPLEQIIDSHDVEAITPLQKEISAEMAIAASAPEMFAALKKIADAYEYANDTRLQWASMVARMALERINQRTH
jgi:hypothetical protein